MTEHEHLITELDGLENRQRAIHDERASLAIEEAHLLSRKIIIQAVIREGLGNGGA